jgi:hypothetical protein
LEWPNGFGTHLDGADGESAVIRHKPRLVTDDMVASRLAVIRGVG